jgi:transglutaminase-like putative cysteine protease
MKISISHQLTLPLGTGSARAVQHLLLTPILGPTQRVKDWSIDMPGMDTAARFIDAFGNRALLVGQSKPEGDIVITVKGEVETTDRNGVLGRVTGEPVIALYKRVTPLTKADPRILDQFLDADRRSGRIALFHGIMERIAELYRFGDIEEPDRTGAAQTQSQDGQSQSQGTTDAPAEPDDREQVDAAGFAHAFVGTVRALDIPARYVTGYLAGEDERPAAFHAWAEAYDDSLGWIGFDAALGICPIDRHVRVAAGLDALSTQPVRLVPPAGEPIAGEVNIEAVAQ